MNLVRVKSVSDVRLDGISIDLEKRDGSIYSIVLTDKNGRTLKVAGSYGVEALVPAPPQKVKKYAVMGKMFGLTDFCEYFDTDYEATERLNSIEKEAGYNEKLGLSVKEVEIEEKEN